MNVLLVETDPSMRRALQFALALHGHQLTVAGNALEFSREARSHPFPLAIIGTLPADDGSPADLCREARTWTSLRQATILVLSPRDAPDAIVAALDAGASGYLSRPLERAQLAEQLALLGAQREEAELPAQSPATTAPAPAPADELTAPSTDADTRSRVLVSDVLGMVLIVDAEGSIQWANAASARLLGRQAGSLVGLSAFLLSHPDDASRLVDMLAPPDAGASGNTDLRLLRGDGSWLDVEVFVHDLRHDPIIAGIVLHALHTRQRPGPETVLRRPTLHDPLTGLPNRPLFISYVERFLALAERRGEPVIVVYVDLDDLQEVNIQHGRATGDALLAAVAERLVKTLRSSDASARLGDDEFAILLADVGSREEASIVVRRLLDALHAPYRVPVDGDQIEIAITCSIGLALSRPGTIATPGESRLEELLRRADRALYRAKSSGRGRWVLYEDWTESGEADGDTFYTDDPPHLR
jgi:diguanylate cyclase (GGDEF)-like protein/PAS domain S-box-containing protein